MKTIVKEGNYTFDKANKKITLSNVADFTASQIMSILNIDADILLCKTDANGVFYAGKGATVVDKIITLDFDTTSMNDTDKLQIVLDKPTLDFEYWATDSETLNPFITIKNYELHEKPAFDAKGDPTLLEYYKNYDNGTKVFSNLAVAIIKVFTRDTSGLVTSVDKTVNFYLKDGSIGITQNKIYYYDAEEGYKFNQKARKNLINKSILYLFNDIMTNELYPITGVNQGTKTFTVTGDITDRLVNKMKIRPSGSTGNDIEFKVDTVTLNGSDTDIVVEEAIPDATADGYMLIGEALVKEFRGTVGDELSQYKDSVIEPLLSAIQASTKVYMTPTRKATLDAILNITYP